MREIVFAKNLMVLIKSRTDNMDMEPFSLRFCWPVPVLATYLYDSLSDDFLLACLSVFACLSGFLLFNL